MDLSRERRLAQVQARGRAGKAADIGDGCEGAQVAEVHGAMIIILHRYWNDKCIGLIKRTGPIVRSGDVVPEVWPWREFVLHRCCSPRSAARPEPWSCATSPSRRATSVLE